MLSVSIIFLYVAFTAYLTGYLALRGIGALFGAMSGSNSKARRKPHPAFQLRDCCRR